MLIASRAPGPRAKKVVLPNIPYGTVRCSKPYMNGMLTSYRFLRKDVVMIARLVHGDYEKHMEAKDDQRYARKLKKRNKEHRALKVRYHTDKLERVRLNGTGKERYHQKSMFID